MPSRKKDARSQHLRLRVRLEYSVWVDREIGGDVSGACRHPSGFYLGRWIFPFTRAGLVGPEKPLALFRAKPL